MTTLEKARKIRNLYNQWVDHSRAEAGLHNKLTKLLKEMESATYSKNGYEYFKILGAWLSEEEAKRQLRKITEDHIRQYGYLGRIEKRLELLMTNKSEA